MVYMFALKVKMDHKTDNFEEHAVNSLCERVITTVYVFVYHTDMKKKLRQFY